jgi:hypothetical protein
LKFCSELRHPKRVLSFAQHHFSGTRVATFLFVARKYYNAGMMRPVVEAAAMNLQTASPLAGIRVPPRVRKIPALRRRLPIVMAPEFVQSVIIRHAGQNLGSVVGEPQPLQPRLA